MECLRARAWGGGGGAVSCEGYDVEHPERGVESPTVDRWGGRVM